jgi:chemotaxis protein MotA
MTAFGLVLGLLIFAWAIVSGTPEFQIFFNSHGVAIVFGGVMAAAFISYPFNELAHVGNAVWNIFRFPDEDARKYVQRFAWWAEVIRKKGLSAIEDDVQSLPRSFLHDAMDLLVAGYTRDEIETNLESAISNLVLRERTERDLFRHLANLAPGFGLVGTLIGLIIMLRNMKDAASIAPSMATAMTATFYGVILANLVFLPVSVKLWRRTESKALINRLIMDGTLLLYEKRPPAFVVDKLNTYLPPRMRIRDVPSLSTGGLPAGV